MGGRYLVHGSPQQRRVESGDTRAAALARAQDCFAAVAARAEKAGVIYCIEPLSADQTPLINTLEEGRRPSLTRSAAATCAACSTAVGRAHGNGALPRSWTLGCRRA
jgi:hypothetical protein